MTFAVPGPPDHERFVHEQGGLKRLMDEMKERRMYSFRGVTLSADIQESLEAYIDHGRPTGSFLRACIENNLSQAINRADETCLPMIPAIIGFLYNESPNGCWGRKGICEEWAAKVRSESAQQQRVTEQLQSSIEQLKCAKVAEEIE